MFTWQLAEGGSDFGGEISVVVALVANHSQEVSHQHPAVLAVSPQVICNSPTIDVAK